jgi:hypothetical protein
MVWHHIVPNPSRVVIDDPIFVLKAFTIINLLVKNNIIPYIQHMEDLAKCCPTSAKHSLNPILTQDN